MSRSRRRTYWDDPRFNDRAPPAAAARCCTLVVIDNRPLQQAAWSEFHAARKRLDKAAGDLHRHEAIDRPAYDQWLRLTFPQMVTDLREVLAAVDRKARAVQAAEFMAAMSGRSIKKVWSEQKEFEADPEAFEKKYPPPPEPAVPDPSEDDEDEFFKEFFGADDPAFSSGRAGEHPLFEGRAGAPPAAAQAREIYRKLVQHLHPDRGGEWTPARERLWHEVQQAWAARDVDWLARLEMDWEIANDTVRPDSSPGRLLRAIADLDAARRDTERKLRQYRQAFEWRFSLSEKKRPQLHRRVETIMRQDLEQMRRQLAYLESTIAAWEAPRSEGKRPRRRSL